MNEPSFEVIIIGGGPAGMSAALVLGRSRIKTLVLNTESPRNKITTHSHGFLTQDGKHPMEIFEVGKKQLTKYPAVHYVSEKAMKLTALPTGFEVHTARAKYTTESVVIATGYTDNIAGIGIPGLTEVYGKSVYPCPFCDGFEMADKKLAVFGSAEIAPMFSKKIWHWSKDVIAFTHGEKVSDPELVANLADKGIQVIEEKIKHIISENGQLKAIELEDGRLINREGGFLPDPKATESTDFALKLGIKKEVGRFGRDFYVVDENKETEIKGLFIIGDARNGWSGVAPSVAEGSEVAAAITHQIIEANWMK